MANNPILAMLFGLIMTLQTHISKAMEKHGIEVFDQIKAKITKQGDLVERDIKKPIIYTLGMILHNTVWIWQILGTSYGLASHVASMFGLGLIALLFYSSKILKEEITRIEYIGAGVLILGTLIIGIENLTQNTLERATINTSRALVFIGIFIIVGLIMLRFGIQQKNPLFTGIIFGIFAGGLGSMDPIFKELGLTFGGGNEITPIHSFGWILYFISFIVGFIALAITQWGFARKVQVSVLVPVYNSIYVTLPIFIQIFTLPEYVPSFLTIIGIIITISGIFLMQFFKDFSLD